MLYANKNDNRTTLVAALTDISNQNPRNEQLKLFIANVNASSEIMMSQKQLHDRLSSMGVSEQEINQVVERLSMSDNSN